MQNRKGMPTWLMSYLFPWQATTGNVSIERMDLKSIPVEDEKLQDEVEEEECIMDVVQAISNRRSHSVTKEIKYTGLFGVNNLSIRL